MILEGPKGAVYIERIPDTKFQAAHPVKIEREVIARTLRGVYARTETSVIQSVLFNSGDSAVARAFSDEDVDYLAPLIVKGLSQAASDQRIGFRVAHPAPMIARSLGGGAAIGSSDPVPSAGRETTAANLYAYGTSLHVTITKYRYRPDRPDTINMPNRRLPDDTGLKKTEIFFYPVEARRPDAYQPTKLLGEPLFTTLVIDHQMLAKLPPAMLVPPAPKTAEPDKTVMPGNGKPSPSPAKTESLPAGSFSSTDQQTVKDMDALKAQMEELRRQMQQQQEEMEKLKDNPGKKRDSFQ
jgi:hypothetical protein